MYIQVSHLDLISFNALMSKFNMWMHMHEYLITCVHTISKIYTALINGVNLQHWYTIFHLRPHKLKLGVIRTLNTLFMMKIDSYSISQTLWISCM